MRVEAGTFLVTGGAAGLGAATARMIVERGGRVVMADLNAERGEALARDLGPNAAFVRTDVTDEAQVQSAVQAGVARWGGLHGLVSCAGIVLGERVLGRAGPHALASFERVVRVNLIGTFNAIRLAVAAMAANPPGESGERGVIVCTASVAAFDGQVGQAAYSASKAGVAGMTLPLARELARTGVRVVTIAPGIFETDMVASFTEEVRSSLAAQIPFPSRLGRPDEYAALVGHIVENQMLNGEVVRLDGAIRMAPK